MKDCNFATMLKHKYVKDPCKVLPNALWKTIDRLDSIECLCDRVSSSLEGWDKNGLHIFWNESRSIDNACTNRIEEANFAIIHNDFFQKINREGFRLIKPYFRISTECKEVSPYSLNERFSISNVNVETELREVSELIGKCYKDIHPSVESVQQWTKSKVFDNNLWIWIVDKVANIPIGLGIADLDRSIPEGSLEWIQVLPEYQGIGLGKVLVLELLDRMSGKVEFVTVSGEVDNITNPERLYRSCGFQGDDVWWLLRK
ncbi:MAG: GCN5-related N-acetyltransferase [Herbinix sp.]|nr:GCN5-related N-acetyltransferase [Herbinix sp.]